MSIGIPIKLLHEAEGHVVTLETTAGEVYRGKLVEAEDNMNVQLQNIQVTARDGSRGMSAGGGKSALLRAKAGTGRGAFRGGFRGGRGGFGGGGGGGRGGYR